MSSDRRAWPGPGVSPGGFATSGGGRDAGLEEGFPARLFHQAPACSGLGQPAPAPSPGSWARRRSLRDVLCPQTRRSPCEMGTSRAPTQGAGEGQSAPDWDRASATGTMSQHEVHPHPPAKSSPGSAQRGPAWRPRDLCKAPSLSSPQAPHSSRGPWSAEQGLGDLPFENGTVPLQRDLSKTLEQQGLTLHPAMPLLSRNQTPSLSPC